MNSYERVKTTLNHEEPDRVPYDLSGTTVTGICRGAFLNAMRERGLSTTYDEAECDPISQIVTPIEETLQALKSDTRRIGARRVPEYEEDPTEIPTGGGRLSTIGTADGACRTTNSITANTPIRWVMRRRLRRGSNTGASRRGMRR